MKEWITGVFAASLLSALALGLCPPGRVRAVTRMVCGILCALAVAGPLARLDTGVIAAEIAAYERKARLITEKGEEEGKMLERTYIEEECAAYISGRAAELGAEAEGVSVLARWDDGALLWYPWEVTFPGAYDEKLSRAVESELGVPAERQKWGGDE